MKKEVQDLKEELESLFGYNLNGGSDVYEIGEKIVNDNLDERILNVIEHAQWAFGEIEKSEKKKRIVYFDIEKDKVFDVVCGLNKYRHIQKKSVKDEVIIWIDERTGFDGTSKGKGRILHEGN